MYPTSPNKANTGDLSRFVGENTQRIDWHNANLCAVFLIFQSLKRYAKQLFQNRSLMNTPVAESVHAEHHKGDLAAQASVAATDIDVMLQLFLGDFFIKGMRKYTNQRFTIVFNNTINLETKSVFMLEIDGFRFSFYIAIDKPTVFDLIFVVNEADAAFFQRRECNRLIQ